MKTISPSRCSDRAPAEHLQEHPWDKMQQGSRWKLTDEEDVPTNLPAWKVYADTIKSSYQKPNRTLERAKAEAYVQVVPQV